jgi:hypothetical protein
MLHDIVDDHTQFEIRSSYGKRSARRGSAHHVEQGVERPWEDYAMITLSARNPDRTETTQFTIGGKVSCRSGHCGRLTRVIIDPIQRTLTHIVVEPHDQLGRLVPLDLVEAATPQQIDLACTLTEFDDLAPSMDTDYFPMDSYYGPYYGGYGRGYGYG